VVVFKKVKKRTYVGVSFHHLALDPFKITSDFRLTGRWFSNVTLGRIPRPT